MLKRKKFTASRRSDFAKSAVYSPCCINHCSFHCGFRTELKFRKSLYLNKIPYL